MGIHPTPLFSGSLSFPHHTTPANCKPHPCHAPLVPKPVTSLPSATTSPAPSLLGRRHPSHAPSLPRPAALSSRVLRGSTLTSGEAYTWQLLHGLLLQPQSARVDSSRVLSEGFFAMTRSSRRGSQPLL
jgi:hypothetical protein